MSLMTYSGLNVDSETVDQVLKQACKQVIKLNRENKRLKRELSKSRHKGTSKKTTSATKRDRIVGYISANDKYFGRMVYENSHGRYLNDRGKRVDATRFAISKRKP